MTEYSFSLLDIAALALVGYGMVRGWMRGLSGELARLIGLGTAVVVGWVFYIPLWAILALGIENGGTKDDGNQK